MVSDSRKNNCSTAALQQLEKKSKKNGKTFEKRNQLLLSLQRQNGSGTAAVLKSSLARIKSRICAHL